MQYITPQPKPDWQTHWPRQISLLGSTGSIGRSALQFIRQEPGRFQISALAGAKNIALLASQANEFAPPCLGLLDPLDLPDLRNRLKPGYSPQFFFGIDGYRQIASLPEATIILAAQAGAAGIHAVHAAATAGKVIALANKESLVLAGELIKKITAASLSAIIPVDSEHSAIFQCLAGEQPSEATRLILTASGGPFRDLSLASLENVRPEDALAHPTWKMGAKISIDSATMMNKGLEIIEACHLFQVPIEHIEVLIHRESIIHSLVEFADGSQLAQMGLPDMRAPIAYALCFPLRLKNEVERLDLARIGQLSFSRPDSKLFPCLNLARTAFQEGGGMPIVLNAANEIAVEAFLKRHLPFTAIARLVAACLHHAPGYIARRVPDSIEEVLEVDTLARELTLKQLSSLI